MSQKKLTSFQYFALIYSVTMERRQKIEDEEGFIKQLTAVLNPIRFRQVYLRDEFDEAEFTEVPGYEVQPDDFEDIDKYLQSLDKVRTARG